MPDKGVLDSVSEKENSRTTAAARDRTGEGQRINEKKRENISRQGAKNTEQENDSPDRLSDVKKNNETEKKSCPDQRGRETFPEKRQR